MSYIAFINLLASSECCAVVVEDFEADVVDKVTCNVVSMGTVGANDSASVEGTTVVTIGINVAEISSSILFLLD